MYSSSLLVLALAVFGASAQTLVSSGCGLNGFNGLNTLNGGLVGGFSGLNGGISGLNGGISGLNGGLVGGVSTLNNGFVSGVSGLNGVSTGVASTPVLENVPLRLPSIVHPTSVQDSCNCIKTIVRPQLRKEVFTIPSVQRFYQTTSTPVVETVPYVSGSSVDVPAVGGVETGVIGGGVSGVNTGLVSGGLVSGVNSGFGTGLVSGINSGFNSGVVSGFGSGVVSGINSGCGLNGVVSGVNAF